jgi:hypothetical protein
MKVWRTSKKLECIVPTNTTSSDDLKSLPGGKHDLLETLSANIKRRDCLIK